MAVSDKPDEFDLIARFFAPLAGPEGLGLKDDAALLRVPAGEELVLSKDVLVADTHFFADDDPSSIGFKAVSVNVSDLAAKGASPKYYLLGLSLPKTATLDWLEGFASGLKSAQDHYGIRLVGGDTTATNGPVTISITAVGVVPEGDMILRSGAKPGDAVMVTGALGDAAFALQALTGADIEIEGACFERFYRPQARSDVGVQLRGIATAAADVSDGLLADMGHICMASGVGAKLYEDRLPVSIAVTNCLTKRPELKPLIWSGGDDYELLFTVPVEKIAAITNTLEDAGIRVSRIGDVVEGKTVELVDSSGKIRHADRKGYRHF